MPSAAAVGEAASSPDGSLSSPPKSPRSPDGPDSTSTSSLKSTKSTIHVLGGALSHHTPSPATTSTAKNTHHHHHHNNSSAAPATATTGTPTNAATTPTPAVIAPPARKKPGPKPKPKDPNAPEKKTRRPRRTAEQIAADAAAAAAAAPTTRKKRQSTQTKSELLALQRQSEADVAQMHAHAQVHAQVQRQQQQQSPAVEEIKKPAPQQQTTTTHQSPSLHSRLNLASVLRQDAPPAASSSSRAASTSVEAQALHNPALSHINNTAASGSPGTPRPASSGQHYDPIRSAYESKQSPYANPPLSPPLNRASASPSITSLIDPPSAAHSSYPQHGRLGQQQQQVSVTSAPVSPAVVAARPAPIFPTHEQQQQHQQQAQTTATTNSLLSGQGVTPMEIDSDVYSAPKTSVSMKKTSDSASAGPASAAPTPPVKAARQKEAPPPLPTGSGLLSGTPFGPMAAATSAPTEPQGVNIWLSFPLKGQNNVTINFAREVEKKYGPAALHPRIAARKERQRQLALAGAALEKAHGPGSADDMSLDLVSEAESNVDMGGMDDDASGNGGKTKKTTRKRKQEDYDKDDDFIDDTELAWEQQALMTQDGFFVYSGPLVTETEAPVVESRSSTTTSGRGRGRGRGSRGGAVRGETSGRGRGRGGGGPGSRGGQTVRKPRVTKAERALMEQEKLEREKLAAQMGGGGGVGHHNGGGGGRGDMGMGGGVAQNVGRFTDANFVMYAEGMGMGK